MTAFAYQAVDLKGKRVRGELEAPDLATLTRVLEARGLLVVDAEDAQPLRRTTPLRARFRVRREVLEVTRALGSLLPAGLPLPKALAASANLATGRAAEAVESIQEGVEGGETLADALSRHPDLFAPVYVGLVRAGERGGDLGGAFQRLSHQLEREDELRARLLSASVYPMLLMLMGGVAIAVLLVFVIPRFAELLGDTGAVLPRSTAIVLGAAEVLRANWPLLVAIPLAAAAALGWMATTEQGRRLATNAQLKIPLLAFFVRYSLAARFARMLGTLLGGGSTLVSALVDTEESLADPVAREECARIRKQVREGSSLQAAVEQADVFPPLLGQLIGVGEEASDLPQFLLKSADIFEEKTERTLQRLVTVLEPTLIVVLGGIVALVALALLQAIYGINAGAFG